MSPNSYKLWSPPSYSKSSITKPSIPLVHSEDFHRATRSHPWIHPTRPTRSQKSSGCNRCWRSGRSSQLHRRVTARASSSWRGLSPSPTRLRRTRATFPRDAWRCAWERRCRDLWSRRTTWATGPLPFCWGKQKRSSGSSRKVCWGFPARFLCSRAYCRWWRPTTVDPSQCAEISM